MSTTNSTAMSDEEMDREWKPSAVRPQSTMARSFSLALNDLFKIDNSVADLDAAVSEKKKAVSSQTSELEALEARLKATEERLAAKQAAGSISPLPSRSNSAASPRQRSSLNGDTFARSPTQTELPKSPLATEFAARTIDGRSERPEAQKRPTYSTPPIPGALPPTPGPSEGEYGSESEYVVVEPVQERPSADQRTKDGEIAPAKP